MPLYAAIAAAIFALGVAAGIKAHSVMDRAALATELEQNAKEAARRADRVDAAAAGHEQFKAAAAVREQVVIKEVERVVERPVYRASCLDDDGLRIIAADIAARRAAGQPAPAVPGASSPAPD